MAALEQPPDPGAGGAGRVERIGAFERIINRLQVLQEAEIAAFVTGAEAAMAARLADHDPRSGPPGVFDTVGHAGRAAAAEIQLMLHLTGAGMLTRLERARLLHDDPQMVPTATLARTGQLTVPKIRKILDGTSGLTPEQVSGLQRAVLPQAPTQTTAQLGAAIQRFLVGLEDREVPVRRRGRAARTRAVVVQAEPDGMATLRAFLPAAAATGILAVVDEHARQCPRSDVRTMDQRRATRSPTWSCTAPAWRARAPWWRPSPARPATVMPGPPAPTGRPSPVWLPPLPAAAPSPATRSRCGST
ncbi:DUF222 domain-containing protein [Pseudonocardia sp. NPDC049635]|uniref:DUF222 domain-containing protein n=1 Tax=Pseudonocardia sp. NPDC049635 TaxID=3155506 RepID=UPI0033E590FB